MTIMTTMTRRRVMMTALPTSSSVLCGLTASFRSRRLFSFAELDLKSLSWSSSSSSSPWSPWSSSSSLSPAIFLLFPVDRSIEEEEQLVQNILSARLLFHLVVIIVIMMRNEFEIEFAFFIFYFCCCFCCCCCCCCYLHLQVQGHCLRATPNIVVLIRLRIRSG